MGYTVALNAVKRGGGSSRTNSFIRYSNQVLDGYILDIDRKYLNACSGIRFMVYVSNHVLVTFIQS